MQAKNTSRLGQRRLVVSRIILLLAALVIALMPVAEYFWQSDGFLRGGHDFELNLLFGLMLCGIVALSAHKATRSPFLLPKTRT